MTGAATDPVAWQQHIRDKKRREGLAKRFKNPKDSLKLVIVRDMWLTGFDVPCLHTMYLDKYMRSHGLMQAIARVIRVFGNKPGGLVVDYLGIAHELKQASQHTQRVGGRVQPRCPKRTRSQRCSDVIKSAATCSIRGRHVRRLADGGSPCREQHIHRNQRPDGEQLRPRLVWRDLFDAQRAADHATDSRHLLDWLSD